MSCADRIGPTRRRAARTGVVLAVLALVGSAAACGAEPDTGATGATSSTATSEFPADARTRRIAEVEFIRQCTIASTSFADEADITTDLDGRLAEAGFTHQEWKQWHDALDDSPELVAQFAEISAAGCPAG